MNYTFTYFHYSLLIVTGLIVFLYGIYILRESLLLLLDDYVRKTINIFTDNYYKAFLIGIVLTIFLQSSSALTTIVLLFIANKTINYKKGLVIIVGANIGTTFTSILISFSLTNYFVVFLLSGFILLSFSTKEKLKLMANVLIGLGFLFLGLYIIRENLIKLINIPHIYNTLLNIQNNNNICFFSSIIITALMQSSSASISIIQEASNAMIFKLLPSFIFVLGANIGTTITGLIVTIKESKEAKKAAFFNFIFNLVFGGIFYFLLIIPNSFFIYIFNKLNFNSMFSIALFHIVFNLISSIIMFFFIIYNKEKTTS